MNSNVGGIDKILCIVVGVGLIGVIVVGVLLVWGYIGIVFFVIGLMGWCLVYLLFGIKICLMQK